MLYFVAVWTALLIGCSIIGTAVLQGCKTQSFLRRGDRLVITEWIGLILLSICLLAVSLILPLTPTTGTGVVLLLSSIALLRPSVRQELVEIGQHLSWQWILVYGVLVMTIATITVQPVTWIDSGLYHYGAIQWLAQYGTVTGIALVFSNLGFVSAWFALAAPFNPPALEARVSAITNGFLLVLLLGQLGIYLVHSLRGRAQASDGFGLIFFGLMLLVIWGYRLFFTIAISPSPDLPITFLVGVVSWAILVITNAPTASAQLSSYPESSRRINSLAAPALSNDQAIPLLLSIGAVSIKLTAMPLLIISSLFYLISSNRSIRQLCTGGAIGLVLLAPLLLAGIKASGCPLYPSSALCLDVPWAQTGATIDAVANATHHWTSWYGTPTGEQHPLIWALSKWLNDRANRKTGLLIGITIAAVAGSLSPLLRSPIRGKGWIMAIGSGGIVFLLMTTTFFRFILPYLLLVLSLLLLIWGRQFILSPYRRLIEQLHRSPLYSNHKPIVQIGALCGIAISLVIFLHTHSAFNLLLPPPMQTVAMVQKRVNDLTYFSPQVAGELCWATPLPCGFEIEQVKLRDPDRGLAGGFIRQDD